MPSVVGEITKGAVFDYIVDGVSVGSEGEAVSLVLVSQGDNTAAWAVVAIAGGGTGQTTQQGAIDSLTAVSGATNEHVLTKDTASGNAIFKAATGGGETNTASNQGTDGVGVYDTKAGVDLQFRHVAPASAKVTVALNGKDIDVDLGSVASTDLSDTADLTRFAFKTINVAVGTDPVATTDDDTLNLTVGNGLSILGISATKTVNLYVPNLGIDTAQLAADAVDGTKIEDDAVNSEHIATGAVDLDHMSVNSVDSDQYVDGSIDTAHIAAANVTPAKLSSAAKAITKTIVINDPYNGQVVPFDYTSHAITFIEVRGVVDVASSSVAFNIEYRNQYAPWTSGTDILTANLTADDNGATTTTFDAAGVVAVDKELVLVIDPAGLTGLPTQLVVHVEYEPN